MSRDAQFDVIEDTPEYLLIRDCGPWDQHRSVTNDAEGVVARLLDRLAGRRLEYLDSEGERAVLLVRDGRFAGFAVVPGSAEEKAGDKRAVVMLHGKPISNIEGLISMLNYSARIVDDIPKISERHSTTSRVSSPQSSRPWTTSAATSS